MRGAIGRRFSAQPSLGSGALIPSSSYPVALFSSSTSSGGGRGRGRGNSAVSSSRFSIGDGEGNSGPGSFQPETDDSPILPGRGHGRGRPLPSSPILPSFSSWMSAVPPVSSSGRGRGPTDSTKNVGSNSQVSANPKVPIFFQKGVPMDETQIGLPKRASDDNISDLRSSITSLLDPAGRGKPTAPSDGGEKKRAENRHLRARGPIGSARGRGGMQVEDRPFPRGMQSTRSRGCRGGRGGGGFRGMEMGMGGRGRRNWDEKQYDKEDEFGDALYRGDDADGERLAERIGPGNMDALVEGFEEMSSRVLPSPLEDAYMDALHTNYMIECEPEYFMADFCSNPDIDEKPPISLRDALEKIKPVLVSYWELKSNEEWEEVMEYTMKDLLPHMKQIVEYYAGPELITAKQQQKKLERIAKRIPASAHPSLKSFADRAVLSLQSNPGWGLRNKLRFMDQLVRDVSKHYK